MGGISNDNVLKFVLGISGLGLSLATFTLSRVFAVEEFAHSIFERVQVTEVKVEYTKTLVDKVDEVQRDRVQRFAIVENKVEELSQEVRGKK